jgi:hypothetical protein
MSIYSLVVILDLAFYLQTRPEDIMVLTMSGSEAGKNKHHNYHFFSPYKIE